MRYSSAAGFTLVEVLVAIVLVTIGVLATAATSALVVRESDEGRTLALVIAVAANRLEELRSRGCVSENGQGAGPRGLTERWSSGIIAPSIRDLRDSVTYSVAGAPHVIVLVSRVPC